MRLSAVLCSAFLAPSVAHAADLEVGPGAPLASIADAVAAAASGDTLWLAAGTWDESITVDGKALTFRPSGDPVAWTWTGNANPVLTLSNGADVRLIDLTLDGQGARRVLRVDQSALTLERSVVRGGNISGKGGGVYATGSDVEVLQSTFRSNMAGPFSSRPGGAAIAVDGGTLWVEHSRFLSNQATVSGTDGGAILAENLAVVTVERSRFAGNSAAYRGGAIDVWNAQLSVSGSWFIGNSAYQAGAIQCDNSLGCVLDANTFDGNSSTVNGGAIDIYNATGDLDRNLFCENDAPAGWGGALLAYTANVDLRNNVFASGLAALGGGVGGYSSATITSQNNTWVSNAAGPGAALYLGSNSSATSVNDLVAHNTSGVASYAMQDDSAPPTFVNALFFSNYWSDHNGTTGYGTILGSDPLLADWPGGQCRWSDFTLLAGSPAIDAGSLSILDSDGSTSDIGATGGPGIDPLFEDLDGDGYAAWEDCNDADPAIRPSATELCDGAVDEDCDGLIDNEDVVVLTLVDTWQDFDGDGFGANGTLPTQQCLEPGWVTNDHDCDDGNGAVQGGAFWYVDGDSDGLGDPSTGVFSCSSMIGRVTDGTDCDDGNGAIGGPDTWFPDIDSDGYGDDLLPTPACSQPPYYIASGGDCDDGDPTIFPGALEVCDEADNDCNGLTDDADPGLDVASTPQWWTDGDGDGYGVGVAIRACVQPVGRAGDDGDCDDTNPAANPAGIDVCNGIDDDCSGLPDDNPVDGTSWYVDLDDDGWGDLATGYASCVDPGPGHSTVPGDCDDADDTAHPGAPETCDGVDNDCNTLVDDEPADGTEFYPDTDGDGHGAQDGDPVLACGPAPGLSLVSDDCNDNRADTWPGAPEICDGNDNDCDALDDEDLPVSDWYPDEDGDGFGDESRPISDCAQPPGATATGGDCDDANPDAYPGARELAANGVDEDCDGADLPDDNSRSPTEGDSGLPGGGSKEDAGCGCDNAPSAPLGWLAALGLLATRRRR